MVFEQLKVDSFSGWCYGIESLFTTFLGSFCEKSRLDADFCFFVWLEYR